MARTDGGNGPPCRLSLEYVAAEFALGTPGAVYADEHIDYHE